MKYACAAWGFRDMTVLQYLDAVKNLGIKNLEINCTDPSDVAFGTKISMTLNTAMTTGQIDNLLESVRKGGLKIVALAGFAEFGMSDKSEIDKNMQYVHDCMDLADRLDARIIRVFAGWPKGDLTKKIFEQVGDCFTILGKYAESKNVMLAIENHGGITSTVEQITRLFSKINSESVGLNYDPANFYGWGEDPVRAIEKLSDHFVYCHLKDCKKIGEEPEFCAVGEGVLDFGLLLENLSKVYDGYCAIEYEAVHDPIEGTKRSLDHIKDLLM